MRCQSKRERVRERADCAIETAQDVGQKALSNVQRAAESFSKLNYMQQGKTCTHCASMASTASTLLLRRKASHRHSASLSHMQITQTHAVFLVSLPHPHPQEQHPLLACIPLSRVLCIRSSFVKILFATKTNVGAAAAGGAAGGAGAGQAHAAYAGEFNQLLIAVCPASQASLYMLHLYIRVRARRRRISIYRILYIPWDRHGRSSACCVLRAASAVCIAS